MGVLFRLAVIALFVWVIYRFLQRKFGLKVTLQERGPDGQASSPPQAMQRCDYCRVHVPEGESTRSKGHFFCSEKHRDAFFREQK